MRVRDLISLNSAKSLVRVFVLFGVLSAAAFAQSGRYSVTRIGVPSAENASSRMEFELNDTDYKIGKVVWVDGKNVGAIVQNYTSKGRTFENFYVCNSKMEMVAELVDAEIAHRSCRLFRLVNGTALEGDWVFLKIIPLRQGTLMEGKDPFKDEGKKDDSVNSETSEEPKTPSAEDSKTEPAPSGPNSSETEATGDSDPRPLSV